MAKKKDVTRKLELDAVSIAVEDEGVGRFRLDFIRGTYEGGRNHRKKAVVHLTDYQMTFLVRKFREVLQKRQATYRGIAAALGVESP